MRQKFSRSEHAMACRRADSSGLLSVDKAEVVIEVVEMVNVTMPAATANETAPKTKAEIKAEAKAAKQVCARSAEPKSSVCKQTHAIDRGGPRRHGNCKIFAVAVNKHV